MTAASTNRHLRAYAMLALVMIFWSGNSIVGRAVRHDIPPFTLAFVRWAGALLIATPVALRHVVDDRAKIGRSWPMILLLGLVGVAAFNGFLYYGLRYTTAANGLLLQALIPPLVLICDALLFAERAGLAQSTGVALSTIGVGLIIFHADLASFLHLRFGYGDGVILIGVCGWALYTSLLRRRPDIHPLSFLWLTFAVAAVVMAPFAAREWSEIITIHWSWNVIGAFAYVAIFPSVIAYFLYNAAVTLIGGGATGQTMSLMPLFGAVLAALLLSEPLHLYHLTGMVLICGGILLTALCSHPSGTASQKTQG